MAGSIKRKRGVHGRRRGRDLGLECAVAGPEILKLRRRRTLVGKSGPNRAGIEKADGNDLWTARKAMGDRDFSLQSEGNQKKPNREARKTFPGSDSLKTGGKRSVDTSKGGEKGHGGVLQKPKVLPTPEKTERGTEITELRKVSNSSNWEKWTS